MLPISATHDSKYADHQPLHRQHRIYLRDGIDLAVSTMCDWVTQTTSILAPLVERLHERALSSFLVQTDATGIKALDLREPENVKKGTMWCYVGDGTYSVFRYAEDGSGDNGPWIYLAGHKGYSLSVAAMDSPTSAV